MKQPVPVLFLIHSLGHGGSERQLALLAHTLDRSRFSAHVASVLGGFRADELRAAGIPVIQIPLRSYYAAGTLQVAAVLRAYIREHHIRLVHAFDYSLGLFGVAVARSSGVVALSSQRFYMDCVPRKYRPLVIASHWMAHGIVANSDALKRYLHEQYRYPLSAIDVCPNGLDLECFHPRCRRRLGAVADADLVIGSVGVLRKEKNLGQLIEAFARVSAGAPRTKLLLVGSGPEEEALKELAARLGLGQACCFLPSTPDVGEALRSIDIFVHPSLSEGMPNGVMEAMACGCAVIASRVGGCPELIQHGSRGLLLEPGDIEDLMRAIRELTGDPETRSRLASAAASWMSTRYSAEASAHRLEQIYQRYLAEKP